VGDDFNFGLRIRWDFLRTILIVSFVLALDGQTSAQTGVPVNVPTTVRRDEWFLRGRLLPGESSAALRYRAHLQTMQMRLARAAALAKSKDLARPGAPPATTWTSLGPAPLASDASGEGIQDYNWVSGRATAAAVDPADPSGNTVYVGGAYGGLWKSSNAGPQSSSPSSVVWTPLIDSQATLAVGAIAVEAQSGGPSLILVGTGETNNSDDSYYGLGILRSADGGNTWTLISSDSTGLRSFAGLGFSQIAFSTSVPNLVAAAVAGATEGIFDGLANPPTTNLGLYYSSDGGNTWNYANVTDGGSATSPDSATSVVYNAAAGLFFAAFRNHGFYSSSNGVNWTRLANHPGAGLTTTACPPASTSPSTCPIYRGELSVVPGRNEMYVWYVDAGSNDQGIWQTVNGGASWTNINDSGIINCGDELGCGTENGTYNLELTAVPDGQATDLYAGSVNLYKCTISSVFPTCAGTGSNTFLNLTHVYGCPPYLGSIAHVHPAQHAAAFMLINGNQQDVMYFANDGGIYRALDGYTGLTTGTCSGTNTFDSLNQTLGSMTEIVSFSQASNDASVILAGSQGNGSPATESAQTSTTWSNVNGGDGGYNQINPDNETEWFVSNPPDSISGVNIFECDSGIGCVTLDFQNDQVVSSGSVHGDTGPYYPPYVLDPQNSNELIVGTCRIWRGPSTGGSFTLLSNNFETGGDAICTGQETNLVRSLASGVLDTTTGLSKVMYAGTDGFGPLVPNSPTGGHLWVSTNVAGGTSTWVDRTGSINPDNFPISSIALDTSDPAGLTAYAGIMGFNVSHLWQTTNGGTTWTDFTGNLPDAPVNTVLVDPGPNTSTGTIYAGTDVGIFYSSTASPDWIELGPAPNSGQAGYLPNVPVTELSMFNASKTKLLRVSTYGRGLWQYPLLTTPDFAFSMSNVSMTIFGGQSAVFTGDVFALYGYNSQVGLSCASGVTAAPPACSVVPNLLTPTGSGAGFTLTAGSALDQDYLFNLQGSDANNLVHDFALTLHVVDFNLAAPSPTTVTVIDQNVSPIVKVQVTAAGAFSGTVNLTCSGLPAGATCNFQPASSVNPTSANPVTVSLTISTSAGTPLGAVPITITANATGAPAAKTQNLTLVVTTGFSITSTSGAQAVNPGMTATYVLSIAPQGASSFANAVIYTCSGLPALALCSFSPASPIAAGSTATSVTLSITTTAPIATALGTPPGTYTVTINGSSGSFAQALPLSLIVNSPSSSNFSFTITNNTGPQTIKAGQVATYSLVVDPTAGTFPNNVTLACSGVPAASTCAFSPPQVGAGSGKTSVAFTVTTTAAISTLVGPDSAEPVWTRLKERRRLWTLALCLPMTGLIPLGGLRRRPARRRGLRMLSALVLGLLLVQTLSCAGGLGGNRTATPTPQPGTLPGTYPITITATTGSVTHTTTALLNVQ
jgi:hypothetical protein